jgi:predicted permease
VFDSVLGDVRFALRWLIRSPGFALVAVTSLAIGIGFNTAIFTVADTLLFRPPPVSDPGKLIDVYTGSPDGTELERFGTSSYLDYLDLKAQNVVLADLIGYSPMFAAVNLGDRSRLTMGQIVTGNYFRMLGVPAAVGRTLLPEDDAPGAPRVAMISYGNWRELGGTADVVGRTLKLRGTPYTIVGVVPRGFTGLVPGLAPELWVSISAAQEIEPVGMNDVLPSPTGSTRLDRRGMRWTFLKGRLRPGVTVEQAGANLELLMARLVAANPISNKDRHVRVLPSSRVHLHPGLDGQLMTIAGGLLLAVGLVLLIACANVASMLLARASSRQKEIGIRQAIGASRGRLVRQLVTESLVLSTAGAFVGLLLAWWTARTLSSLQLPIPFPIAIDFRIDGRVLLFTTLATLAAALLAGIAPAILASRLSVTADLRGEALRSQAAGHRWSLRDVMVALQMAITVLLLVVAALLSRSLAAAQRTNLGFEPARLALVSIETSMLSYTPERSEQFFARALTRVRTIPGVDAAALATYVPLTLNYNRWPIWIPGHHRIDQPPDTIDVTRVSSDYFPTIGVPILEGRAITTDDRQGTPNVAVVNETMARRYWAGESAVGKTFRSRGPDGPIFQIVGVSADHKVSTVGEASTPFIQFARDQQPNPYSCLIARTRGDANALLRDMRREILALDPDIIFIDNQTMEAEVATTLFPARMSARVVSAVGIVALMLAAIGLYGAIAYSVARRTREIGIRMALGARPASVLGLVMGQGLAVAAVGVAVGCLLAAAAARFMAGLLYDIGAADPLSWTAAVVVVLGVAALANFIPARRAARVAPSEALRTE